MLKQRKDQRTPVSYRIQQLPFGRQGNRSERIRLRQSHEGEVVETVRPVVDAHGGRCVEDVVVRYRVLPAQLERQPWGTD